MTKPAAKAALAAAAGAALLVAFWRLPLAALIVRFIEGLRSTGPLGPVLLAAAYVPACVLFAPGALLTLGGGWAFGLGAGAAAASVGATAGACAAFWLGRTVAREFVEGRVAADPRFRAIDRAVGRAGFKIVFLTRLSPLFPFNLLNYAFGVTSVRFRDYALASWIGMLPGTVLYAYLGTAAGSLAEAASGRAARTPAQWALLALGLAATIAVAAYVARVARKALEEAGLAADA